MGDLIRWCRAQPPSFAARGRPAAVVLYPAVSDLPPGLVHRPLLFRRDGPILPPALWPAPILNAALFAFAHLMSRSRLVAAMTFGGTPAAASRWR